MNKSLDVIIGGIATGVVALIIYYFWGYATVNTTVLKSPAVYEGLLSYAFEVRNFSPCNYQDEHWWVLSDNGDIGYEPHFAATGEHGKVAFVRALMNVSSKGQYGLLGMSDREVVLLEIDEVSSVIPESCKKT